ncbi:hypothetical protein [Halopiger thermotolerans]
MELSPEEYGAYWRASIRIAAGLLAIALARAVTEPLFAYSNLGAVGLGAVLFALLVLAGTFVATLGFARVVRTAVDAEMRG